MRKSRFGEDRNRHTMGVIAAGVSTRKYRRTLDRLPEDVAERAAVSRRFVALSTQQLHVFVSRPLGELDLRVVLIDGKVFKDHRVLIGAWIRRAENTSWGFERAAPKAPGWPTALLGDLVERGLATDQAMLFIFDGAKALRRAISDVYGEFGLVQRCKVHKRSNVLVHLPTLGSRTSGCAELRHPMLSTT